MTGQSFARLMIAVAVCPMVGCGEQPAAAPMPTMTSKPIPLRNVKQAAHQPTGDGRYATYNHGISRGQISKELNDLLDALLPDRDIVTSEFDQTLARIRQGNSYLDQALRQPDTTPIQTPENKLPGPRMQDVIRGFSPIYEALLADYEANSADSLEVKEQIARLHRSACFKTLSKDQLNELLNLYEAGHHDPLVLIDLLRFEELDKSKARQIQQHVVSSFRSRECSDLTRVHAAFCLNSLRGYMPPDDLVYVTKMILESMPKVWSQYGHNEQLRPMLFSLTEQAMYIMNGYGSCDLALTFLKGNDETYPPVLRHAIASLVYGQVMLQSPKPHMGSYDQLKDCQARHLLKAWPLDLKNGQLMRWLLTSKRRSGVQPLSASQWFRIALTTISDDRWFMRFHTRTLQPMSGGTVEALAAFSKILIDLAAVDPGFPLLYHSPAQAVVEEESWSVNAATGTGLGEQMAAFVDMLKQASPDKPDSRLTTTDAALTYRILWDAHDLKRLAWFSDTYRSILDRGTLYDYRIPLQLSEPTLRAFSGPGAAAWQTIQADLLNGNENFDDAKLQRIADALDEAEKHVDAANPGERDTKSDAKPAEESKDIESLPVGELITICRQLLKFATDYHNGETVELIANGPVGWSCSGNCDVSYNSDSIDIESNCLSHDLMFTQPLKFKIPLVVEVVLIPDPTNDGDPYGVALYVGPHAPIGTHGRTSGRSLRYSSGPMGLDQPILRQSKLPHDLPDDPHFVQEAIYPIENVFLKMEVWENGTRSYVNNTILSETSYSMRTLGHVELGRSSRMSFMAPNLNAKYSIKRMRISKFDATKKDRRGQSMGKVNRSEISAP